MPTYVYKFIDSGETVEVQQSFNEDTLTELAHPRTGEVMPVRKVFLPVGVTFKGGGFYKTDSRGGKSSSSTTSSTSSADTSSGDSASSTDSSTSTSAKDTNGSSTKTSTPAAATSSAAS